MNLGSAADSLGSSADSDLVEVEPSAGPSSAGQASSSSYAYGDSAGVAEDAPARMPPLVRNASWLSEEPSSSASSSLSGRPRRPSSSSSSTVNTRRRASRGQIDPPTSPGAKPSSRKSILRGTREATTEDQDVSSAASRNRSNSSGGRPNRPDSRESGSTFLHDSETTHRNRSASGPYSSSMLAEGASPRSQMNALWESKDAYGSPSSWTTSRRPSAASSGAGSRGGRRRGSSAAMSSSATEEEHEAPPPLPRLDRERIGSTSSTASSLSRLRRQDLDVASTDSVNGLLKAPPTMMRRLRSKSSRESFNNEGSSEREESKSAPSTLGKLFGGLRKSKSSGQREEIAPQDGRADGVAGNPFAVAAASPSGLAAPSPSAGRDGEEGRAAASSSSSTDESGARGKNSSSTTSSDDYYSSFQSPRSLASHPYAIPQPTVPSAQHHSSEQAHTRTTTTTTTTASSPPRANGLQTADPDWTAPTPTNATFAIHAEAQQQQQEQQQLQQQQHSPSSTADQQQQSPTQRAMVRRSGSWPPRGDKKQSSFVTLQNGQSRGVGGSRFQNAASHHPRTPSPNALAFADATASQHGAASSMVASASASSNATQTTTTETSASVHAGNDDQPSPLIGVGQGSPQLSASMDQEERRKARRARKHLRSRPQSGQSVSSWHIPLPRSSSLRSYDGGETGPFPTPPPRSSSSSQQGFDFGSYDGAGLSSSPKQQQQLSVDATSPLPSPRSPPSRPAPQPPLTASGSASKVAQLASKFGGSTKLQAAPRASPEAKAPAQSYFDRLARYRGPFNALATSPPPRSANEGPSSGPVADSMSSAEVAAWVNTANGQSTAAPAPRDEDPPTIPSRGRAPSTTSIYEDAPQTLPSRNPSSSDGRAANRAASESTHAASSAEPAVTALSARPDRPVKSSRRPGTAQTLETSHRSDPLQPLSSTKRSSGVAIVEGAPQNDANAAATGPIPSANALGVSPLRSSVEMAARMGGTFDMTEQHAKSAGAAGLAEPLVLSTSRDRSASSHGAVNHREEANVDEALQLEEEEYGDEVAEELGDVDEDENGRLEVPTTPGRRKGSLAARAKNLRKVTPPALASAFRQRKSSAGGEGTLRGKKWPFGAKDEQSEAEEERQPRSARASMRKKKDVTPARPQIRRVWEDEAGQLSPEDKVSGMLAPKPSIASFQSGASSLQDPAALSAEGGGERSSSSVPPSPAVAGRSRTPPLAWTKGELDGETKRILKRRNVIRELVHTERSYASDLAVIRDVYLARARAKLGSWPSPSPGTPWSTFSAGSPLNHPGSATSSTSFLPYRNAAASRGYFRSASGEVALGSHSQLQAISPSLHRKASSPAMATPPMVFDAKLHPMPSPAPSGTISNRSSVVTSGSKSGSKAESISSDATRSSSRPTDATSKSASEDRSGAAATDAAGMPATPPMITTSTSTTSTFQDAHTHMASLISRGAAGSSGAGDGTPPAGERPAVTIDTRSSASTPGAVINNDAPLSFSDIRVIFAGVEACTAFADEMTNLLEGSMGTLATNSLPADAANLEDTNDDLIGLAFRQLSARIQQVYGAYCSKHEASIARLRDVTTSSPRAAQFFKECTAVARRRTNAWDLASLLIKPVQRMLKYPLLLKQILAATPSTHPDYENLVAAIEEIQRVADSINELNRRREIITQIIGAKTRGVNGNGSAMGSASSSARNVSGGSSVDAAGSGTTSGITRSMTSSKLASSKTLRRKGQGSTPTIATDLAAVGPNVLESTQLPGLLAKFNSLQAGVERLATEYSRWPTLLRASIASQLDLLSAWRIVYACKTERETVHEMERESEQLAAFAALCQEMLEGPWAKLDRAVQLSLLPNMDKVRAIFAGPREVMMRRDEREEDYVKYRALLLAKGEQGMKASSSSSLDSSSQHRRLVESANGFAALHLHLVDELPEFLLGVECMIDALVAAFARIQTEYLGSIKGIMDGFFQGRPEGAASSPAIGATASSAEVASNASHGTSGTVASGRERTAAIVRNWWSAHQTWAMQVEGLRVCQSGSSSGDSDQRPTMLGEMKKSGSYSFEKSGAGPGVSSIAGAVMGSGSPTTSRRSLPRISGGSTSGPSGVSHSSSTDTPSPLMNMQHSTSSVSLSQDGSSSASSSYLTPGNMSTAGRLSVNGANGGGYRSNGALDVAPGSGGPSPAGSRKGSILRSLSGTLRGGHPSDADGSRGESPLPPLPPLPATPVGGLPVPPPKDNRLAASRSAGSATAPPMLPTLDLGAGDLSPEVSARALDESQISPALSTNGGRLPSLEAAANGNGK